jgi:hypothetical protein
MWPVVVEKLVEAAASSNPDVSISIVIVDVDVLGDIDLVDFSVTACVKEVGTI